MFVDIAKVFIQAGKGGDGAVSFRHEIYVNKGGPDGGNGGKGGDVVFVASKDANTLVEFRFQPELTAESGMRGSKRQMAGRSGKDLVVEVPVGTVVRRISDGAVMADLAADGARAIVARGGDGGFGNAHFKSSVRQTPKIAEVGEPGEEFEAELELKLLADVGLVGLPNAGKSTFLSVVSNARPEIADYAFTTLTPSLGVATVDETDILIADIPGLIEGASEGRGLGDKFLRHVERTAVLLHLVDVYNDDAGAAYRTIREELRRYADGELAERPEVVALTKCEGVDAEIIEMQKGAILAVNPGAEIFAISAAAHEGITELLRAIREKLKQNLLWDRTGIDEKDFSENGAGAGASSRAAATSSLPPSSRMAKSPQSSFSAIPRISQQTVLVSCEATKSPRASDLATADELPVITLAGQKKTKSFAVEKVGEIFMVTGEKIEKFARMTDYSNYDSVNRLRDIMKKMGIRGELTNKGAIADSVISIADHKFTLMEQ